MFTINGYLIASYGNLKMRNVELISNTPPGRASVFVHANNKLGDSCRLTDITVICPQNTQLETHNSSLESLTRYSLHNLPDYLEYRMVAYDCILCPEGHYALGGGTFSVRYDPVQINDSQARVIDASDLTHKMTYRLVVQITLSYFGPLPCDHKSYLLSLCGHISS